MVYDKEELSGMKIPRFLHTEMKHSLRLHMENNLEMRIKFILKVKEFVTIEINVLDVTGDVVLSDSLLPTQLQLEFVREGLN